MEKNTYYELLKALLEELLNRKVIDDFDWGSFDEDNEQLVIMTNDRHLIAFDYSTFQHEVKKITYDILPPDED